MLRRCDFTELKCVLGIMVCLLHLVQSEMATIDTIKQLLYKTKLTEEESSSNHMPEDYLCDACLAMAYSLKQVFKKAEKMHKTSNLLESSLVEAVELLCENEHHWEAYGLKEIDGKKRFAGPGLKTDTMFGLLIEGNLWTKRMMDFCWKLTEEIEEVELYKIFQKKKLIETLCRGELNYCKESRKRSEEL